MLTTEHMEVPALSPILTGRGNLGVIGAGVMGRTLIKGLFKSGVVHRSQIWAAARTEKTCLEASGELQIPTEISYKHRVAEAELLLLCVKPSQLERVLGEVKEAGLREDTLLISILAGVTTTRIESALGMGNPVVRAMPNTPCIVGDGMTVIAAGRYAASSHMLQARHVFEAVGRCLAVDESYCNAITALSGSGPAYVYLIIEALADAGVRVGLPRDLALNLVTQTMLGAARMVQESGRHPAALRDDVTTPAGCTIGGLLMLEDGKIRSVLARAIEESTRIVAELGKPKNA
jgi:pyrroline-5-carboxylate reductase